MANPTITITIGGLWSANFSAEPFTSPERNIDYHKMLIDYEIKPADTCHIVTVTVKHTVFIISKLLAVTTVFKTIYYVVANDYSFMKHPTDPFTISTFSELTQIAIAHTRPYLMMEGQAHDLGTLIIPLMPSKEIEKLTKEFLLTSLN